METFYTSQSFDNSEQYFELLRTWDLEFSELSSGKFHADLLMFGDAELQFVKVRYNKQLLQQGTGPLNGYTFALHQRTSAPFFWRYLDFPEDGIIVFPENNEHHGISQPGHSPITITVSDAFLVKTAEAIGLPAPEQFISKGVVHRCERSCMLKLQTLLESACSMSRSTEGAFLDTPLFKELKQKTARLILLALASGDSITAQKREFGKRKLVVDRVFDFIDSDPATPPMISDLCNVGGVSERTLRNIFYEQFSLSPKKVISCHRLNAVRAAFKRLDSSALCIADVANQYGYWHMGQFAADYRKLFGENPSATLG